MLAAVRVYAADNPLCAQWSPEKERRSLEAMAYSFVNKFPDYADRLPPDLYAARQVRRGQGVLEPQLEYDRLHRVLALPGAAKPATARTRDRHLRQPPSKNFG